MSVRRWSLVLGAALLAGSVSPAVAAAPTATSRPQVQVQVAESPLWMSPNGDGRHDRARLSFSLNTEAKVTVLVRHGRDIVLGPEHLGRLDAGRHRWTWDGRLAGGAVVKDGTFSIVVRAARDGRTDTAAATTYVDRVADAGRLVTTRPTVYPKASIVSDRVGLIYLREGWNADEAQPPGSASYILDDRSPVEVSASVVDSSGRVVWQREWSPQRWWEDPRGFTFGNLFWYARGAGGEPVPAGTYDARVRVTDAAGNVATYGVPIAVSHQQLRRETWTSTVPAASAPTQVPAGCGYDCTDGCSPVASERFAGGLSFRSCPDIDSGTRAWFIAAVPVAPAPGDSYRIMATGGPTIAGSDDAGSLSGYVQLGPGDMTVSTPWTPVELDTPPYLPDQRSVVPWSFVTHSGNAYDVATFTVEYRYYVPAA